MIRAEIDRDDRNDSHARWRLNASKYDLESKDIFLIANGSAVR